MAIEQGLALFATDVRPRYMNDILTVLSLPEGAAYQFRYDNKYFPNEVRYLIDQGDAPKTRALVCFRGQPNGDLGECIIPVRYVEIIRVDRVADFTQLHFIVDGYPKSLFDLEDVQKIATASATYLESLPANQRLQPVQRGFADLAESDPNQGRDSWIQVARSLSRHPTYSESHFLRVESLETSDGGVVRPTSEGYELSEQRLYHVNMHYYAEKFGQGTSTLRVKADEAVIRTTSIADKLLDSRYDNTTSWFHAQAVLGTTQTELYISITDERAGAPQTKVTLPVAVKRSNKVVTRQVVLNGLSGALIASPAILGPGTPLALRIILALLGAFLLAFTSYVIKRQPK